MDTHEAESLALALIDQYAPEFRFEWSQALTQFGSCHHRTRTIKLSKRITEIAPDEAVRDVVLHEIAHALAGASHNHDETWKRFARSLGAPDSVTVSESRVGNPRQKLAPWVGTCPAGHVSPDRYFRKPRARYACSICCNGKWSAEHVLTYRREF
jgi:predicted SprT family Zn-dependent metalloprotease